MVACKSSTNFSLFSSLSCWSVNVALELLNSWIKSFSDRPSTMEAGDDAESLPQPAAPRPKVIEVT
jgi:hypothetical protein